MNKGERIKMVHAMRFVLNHVYKGDSFFDVDAYINEELEWNGGVYPKELLEDVLDEDVPIDDTNFSYMLNFFVLIIMTLTKEQHNVLECDGIRDEFPKWW